MSPPPTPDLTPAESETLREALAALLDECERTLAGSQGAAQPVDVDDPIGRVSRIDAIQQQEMAQASRAGIRLRAQQARAALQRFAEGTYGRCVLCEEAVGYARLNALPETPFCMACQTRRERR